MREGKGGGGGGGGHSVGRAMCSEQGGDAVRGASKADLSEDEPARKTGKLRRSDDGQADIRFLRSLSAMDIEVRAGAVVVHLLPELQLGNLQVAALAQWKGVQAALGEEEYAGNWWGPGVEICFCCIRAFLR